jgi:hypothetical protein
LTVIRRDIDSYPAFRQMMSMLVPEAGIASGRPEITFRLFTPMALKFTTPLLANRSDEFNHKVAWGSSAKDKTA